MIKACGISAYINQNLIYMNKNGLNLFQSLTES